jgi:DNA polymerase III subunit beta
MQFTCSQPILDRHLQAITRIVSSRTSVPVLANILIETDKDVVRFSTTDLELAMTTQVAAVVEQEGTFTVPARIFADFVHQNPDQELHLHREGYELVVQSKSVDVRIGGMDAEEYPPLPRVEDGTRVHLPAQDFVDGLKKVMGACAQDYSRPVLSGICMQFEDELLTLAATDSFRLAECTVAIPLIQKSLSILLPSRTAQEIVRLVGTEKGDFELIVGELQVLCKVGDVHVYSRLLSGSFPKYKAIIPTTVVAKMHMATQDCITALRLCQVFSQAGITNVTLDVQGDGVVTLSTYGSAKGSTKHTLLAHCDAGFTAIKNSFNARFLLDACATINSDTLTFTLSGTRSAMLVTSPDSSHLQLVMPIRQDG